MSETTIDVSELVVRLRDPRYIGQEGMRHEAADVLEAADAEIDVLWCALRLAELVLDPTRPHTTDEQDETLRVVREAMGRRETKMELRQLAGEPEDVLETAEEAYLQAIYMTTSDEPQNMVRMVARAILAERERVADQLRDLADCLSDMTEHYVELAGCGDCGNWDPEEEIEVQAARKMIASIRNGHLQLRDENSKEMR